MKISTLIACSHQQRAKAWGQQLCNCNEMIYLFIMLWVKQGRTFHSSNILFAAFQGAIPAARSCCSACRQHTPSSICSFTAPAPGKQTCGLERLRFQGLTTNSNPEESYQTQIWAASLTQHRPTNGTTLNVWAQSFQFMSSSFSHHENPSQRQTTPNINPNFSDYYKHG